jgi:glycine cleavage system aminomethyltransferase T
VVPRPPAAEGASIVDLTSSWTTIGIWGPNARDILASITADDVSNEGFKFGTCRTIEIGTIRVLASRISYVGDLGWELYVPIEQGAQAVGHATCGTPARRTASSRSASASTAPPAAREGLPRLRQRARDRVQLGRGRHDHAEGQGRRLRGQGGAPAPACRGPGTTILCSLTVDDHTSSTGEKRYMIGREPILTADGGPITDAQGRRSYVTSAGSAPSLGKHILMSYLPPEHAVEGTKLAVEYLGEQYPVTVARVGSKPLFDPENERILG